MSELVYVLAEPVSGNGAEYIGILLSKPEDPTCLIGPPSIEKINSLDENTKEFITDRAYSVVCYNTDVEKVTIRGKRYLETVNKETMEWVQNEVKKATTEVEG